MKIYRIGRLTAVAMLSVTWMASYASGQTLWLAPESDGEMKVHCYFSGFEDRANFVDKVSITQVWRTNERERCEPVFLRNGGNSFWVCDQDEGLASTYWLSHDFGISEMDGVPERVFLHAKTHTSADPSTWRYVTKPKHFAIEIIPRREKFNHRFTVLSVGRPLAEAKVNMLGPDSFKQTGDTDENGEVTFELPQSGMYGLRVRSVHSQKGLVDGRSFVQTVHVSTLSLPLEVIPDMKLITLTTK
jgi:hypothetical protein